MHHKNILPWILLFLLLAGLILPAQSVRASNPHPIIPLEDGATAYDLILAMNTLRVSNGLPALIEDPIIDAVAQSTAEIMAANLMTWHIGDVRGRLAAAGYGGGGTVWATENFAVGHMALDEIMVVWSDAAHMIPAVKPAYCNIGAGVAKASNGSTYYVLQAAYTSDKSCGDYTSKGGSSSGGNSSSGSGVGYVMPVKVATPDADGKIYHVVQAGQSFWAIAVAYHVTIHDIEVWNNLSKDVRLQIGQKLFIPSSNTAGYATPTPVGMFVPSTPDSQGKVVHTVEAYQNLTIIAQAYKVPLDTILALNGMKVDTPLQIGQKLLISPGTVTPSPTPRPLTPIEKLTPESDGKYYHVVKSGESLSWIASLYSISVSELMAWNGLNSESIIRPEQKLLLQVTPPATITFTPGPPTATATVTPTLLPTRTPTASRTAVPPTPAGDPVEAPVNLASGWLLYTGLGLLAAGIVVVGLILRKRR